MLNKLICLEEKISWNCIVTLKFMWNQNSKTANQDYWHTCFIRLPRFWATSPQPKQKTPKKSWIAIFQSAKSSIVQFLPINQKIDLHKSFQKFVLFLKLSWSDVSAVVFIVHQDSRNSYFDWNYFYFVLIVFWRKFYFQQKS